MTAHPIPVSAPGSSKVLPMTNGANGTAPEWPIRPTPLSAAVDLPAFPVDVLPDWLRDEVSAIAEATQTPDDLAGMLALAVLSTAASGRVVVNPGWWEPCNLFATVALGPGNLKSAVFREITRPVWEYEHDEADRLRPLIEEAKTRKRIADKAADKTETDAGNAKAADRAEKEREAIDARQAANEIAVPILPRLVCDDATVEALTSLLAEQSGRLAVLSAEGGVFDIMAGRYSKEPNFEVFLKAHAGDQLRVDRKGRAAEHVDRPALTLGLAIQPEVLSSLAHRPGFRGRGLVARFLFSLPTSTVGSRNVTDPRPVPTHVSERYARQVRGLLESFRPLDESDVLDFAQDASEAMIAYRQTLEPKLGPGGGLHHIADWVSKLHGVVARISGLLHVAEHGAAARKTPIPGETVTRSIRLADYLLSHALAAFDLMGATAEMEKARTLLRWIVGRTEPAAPFTKRDAHQAHRSVFPRVADLEEVLPILEEYGYVRQVKPKHDGKGGRPSVHYAVHPRVCSLKTLTTLKTPSEDPSEPGFESFEGFEGEKALSGNGNGTHPAEPPELVREPFGEDEFYDLGDEVDLPERAL